MCIDVIDSKSHILDNSNLQITKNDSNFYKKNSSDQITNLYYLLKTITLPSWFENKVILLWKSPTSWSRRIYGMSNVINSLTGKYQRFTNVK